MIDCVVCSSTVETGRHEDSGGLSSPEALARITKPLPQAISMPLGGDGPPHKQEEECRDDEDTRNGERAES